MWPVHSARSSSNLLGLFWTPPPLVRCRDPPGPLLQPAVSSPGKGCQAPAGTFILAERRERCSQAQGRRTEPFCLNFPPCYSNQQHQDKNAPFLDNGPASCFSPSVFLPRNVARTCLEAQWLSGGERPTPTPLRSLAVPREVRPGRRDAASASPYPAGPACRPRPGHRTSWWSSGLPPRTSPRDCVSGWMALSGTNSSFFSRLKKY